jgi:hypothetical protein
MSPSHRHILIAVCNLIPTMMILGAILLLASSTSAFPLGRSISNTLGGIITGKSKLTFNAAGNFKVLFSLFFPHRILRKLGRVFL